MLLLVDPMSKVPSTADVPHHNSSWTRELLQEARDPSPLSKLPYELLDYIAHLSVAPLSEQNADEFWSQRERERQYFESEHDHVYYRARFKYAV